MSEFEVREDEHGFGRVLILKGSWTDGVALFMEANGIDSLRLSDSFGSKSNDLSFLSRLSFLRGLEIYCWEAKTINVVESLPQLELIGLQCKSTAQINFEKFQNLKMALVTWSSGLGSLLNVSSLEKLNIQRYPYVDLNPMSALINLKRLYLTSRKLQSLAGISRLASLEALDLYNCPNLESLSGSESCPKLVAVEVENCPRVSA
jgi:uncharacterized protein with PQ loop repeat